MKVRNLHRVALLFSFIGMRSHAVDAQSTFDRAVAAAGTDSAAWQSVLMHVVSGLSTQIVRVSLDANLQPWRFQLPDGEPQRARLEAQLRTILRARAAVSSDSIVYTLELGPLLIRGDTARVKASVSTTQRCPDTTRTTGSGWVETVLVPRHPRLRSWGAAFSRSSLVGDKVSC